MKVLFDHQVFSIQNRGGISEYFSRLNDELSKLNCKTFLPLLISQNQSYSKALLQIPASSSFPYIFSVKYYPNLLYSMWALLRREYDIFHPTYFDTYFLKFLNHKPLVITIFDMIHELYPLLFDRDDQTSNRKRLLAIEADKIIAISESTKRDIIRIFKIPDHKIAVIHLASNRVEAKTISKINRKFLLFVGNRGGYKNFNFFVSSIASLLLKENYVVYCAGGGAFTESEKRLLRELQLQHLVIQKDVTDKQLNILYASALVLVYPSLYEGFGLPIIEAFSAHCPVVCSNTSFLPEVGGDAAQYFDPTSATEIYQKVSQVMTNKKLRATLIEKGKKRSLEFSWKKMAQQTLAVYKEVYEKHIN